MTALGKFLFALILIGPAAAKPRSENWYSYMNNFHDHEVDQLRRREADRIRSFMNNSVPPCDDFYEYACGNFVNTLEDFSGETESVFSGIVKNIKATTLKILNNTNSPSDWASFMDQKVKDYFKSCVESSLDENVDEVRNFMRKLGDFPVVNSNWTELNKHFNWIELAAKVHRLGGNTILVEEIGRSPVRSINVIFIGPAEPSNMNYDDLENDSTAIYSSFIYRRQAIFQAIGADAETAKNAAEDLYLFERELVKIFGPDYHNLEHEFNELDFGVFRETYPEQDWDKFFEILIGRHITDSYKIVVRFQPFLRPVLDFIGRTKPETVANYLLYEMLDTHFVSYLGDEPDPETCADELEDSLHYILTAIYVRDYYDEKTRKGVEEVVSGIKESVKNLVHKSELFDDESRVVAEKKINGMRLLNGFMEEVVQPSWLQDNFGQLIIFPRRFIKNLITIRHHVTRLKQNIVNKHQEELPKYYLNFYSFNAFYYYGVNILATPLGFQNLPIYHPKMPMAYNFGSLGSFVGHEITHAFDSKGRKYDADGNIRNWWSNATQDAFQESSQCLVDAFNKYTFDKDTGVFIDGKVTLPENIADQGGVRESYHAYENWLQYNRHFNVADTERLPGINLTNLQLFFLSYAQFWCQYVNPEDFSSLSRSDHSPAKFRVLGTLSHFDQFAKQFSCEEGSAMNPPVKCSVW